MSGLADRQADRRHRCGRRDAREQLAQALERIGLQQRELRVQRLETRRHRIVASNAGLYVTPAAPPAPWRWRAAAAVALLAALALLRFDARPLGVGLVRSARRYHRGAGTGNRSRAPALRRRTCSALAGAPPANAPAGADLGDIRLLGVFAKQMARATRWCAPERAPPMLVAAGQDIAPGVRVESVRPDGISVLQGGVRQRTSACVLPGTRPTPPRVAASAAAPAACAIPPGFKGPVVASERRAPRRNDRRARSVEGTGRASVGCARRARSKRLRRRCLGLKNGDRVERANGIALAIPDDIAATILRPLTRSQPVWLAGTRDGKPQQWLYLNAGSCPG